MAGPLLPTYDDVRAATELVPLSSAPTHVFRVAAIVLQVDGVRREEWTDDAELSPALFARFPRTAAPPPDPAPPWTAKSYRVLDEAKPPRTTRCLSCAVTPGFALCPRCGGRRAFPDDGSDVCLACDGSGRTKCPTCDGEREVVSFTVRYVDDRPHRVRQLFVPQVHDSLRSELAGAILADARWDEELAFDPAPAFVASAYRGATAVRAADAFHGHYFGNALDAALAARDSSTTGVVSFRQRFFAIPILWLVQAGEAGEVRDRHSAYFYDSARRLRQVLAVPTDTRPASLLPDPTASGGSSG